MIKSSITHDEDIGVFLSIAALISKGYLLYVDVWDNKDPLFHYLNAFGYYMGGVPGVYLISILMLVISGIIVFRISLDKGISILASFVFAMIFVSIFSGDFYTPVRSQQYAMVFFLTSYLFLVRKQYQISGIFMTLTVFSKFPFLGFVTLHGISLLLLSKEIRMPIALKFLKGLTLSALSMLILLAVRGELTSYLATVVENFRYSQIYPEIIGEASETFVRIETLQKYFPEYLAIFILCSVVTVITVLLKAFNLIPEIVGIWTIIGFIALTTIFPHHLHVTSLLFALLGIVILCILRKLFDQVGSKKYLLKFPLVVFMAALVIGSVVAIPKFKPNWNVYLSEITRQFEVEAPSTAPGTEFLKDGLHQRLEPKAWMRLGGNDDFGFGMYLPPSWKLACSRPWIYGFETEETLTRTLKCIESKVNVLIIAPSYHQYANRLGTYQLFYQAASKIVQEKFNCQVIRKDNYQVCYAKRFNPN